MQTICTLCDQSIESGLCVCGINGVNMKKEKKYTAGRCQMQYTLCMQQGVMPILQNGGVKVMYCMDHYNQVRPKSALEIELEKRAKEFEKPAPVSSSSPFKDILKGISLK